MKVKTRFAPSPTGKIHIGNIRTALFSYLYARAMKGSFMLRIEDTDLQRSEALFSQEMMQSLTWLGIIWDEGPGIEKENAPYYQSQRSHFYEKLYQQLIDHSVAYPCFCSEQELAISKKIQLAQGKAPRYAGTCGQLTSSEIQRKQSQGEKFVLRFRSPKNTHIEFIDFVKGPLSFQTNDIGDFIIRRADGSPSFIFCNAVDDALMNVTHVIRGEDHVANTPRQILILTALGLRIPEYGHVSLITGLDGAPLSKRHGSNNLDDLKNMGFLPWAIVNYLARLGHHYDQNSLLKFNELSQYFRPEHLNKSPAKFDQTQLIHWQKLALQELSNGAFWTWASTFSPINVPADKRIEFVESIKANTIFPDDVSFWADILFTGVPVLNPEELCILKETGTDFFDKALYLLEIMSVSLDNFLTALRDHLKLKGKKLYMPIRLSLTGQQHGPELDRIMQLLGKEEICKRLTKAKEMIQGA